MVKQRFFGMQTIATGQTCALHKHQRSVIVQDRLYKILLTYTDEDIRFKENTPYSVSIGALMWEENAFSRTLHNKIYCGIM